MTLADVAALAQVDPSVVSRVINSDQALRIRPETRTRVLAAVKELNYSPNLLARGLRTHRAQAVGLVIPDFENPVYSQVITGAERTARSLGWALLTTRAEAKTESWRHLIESRVDGLLLAGGVAQVGLWESSPPNIPWLLLNRRVPGLQRHLILDDAGAAAMAVRHLHRLGHERIGVIAGPPGADTADRRIAGYVQAAEDLGLEVEPAWIKRAEYSSSGGAWGMRELMNEYSRPSAVLVASVVAAVGAMSAAWQLGYGVPRDVSVIAIHDLELVTHLVPPLSTVRMPLTELGQRGIEILSSTSVGDVVEEVLDGPLELKDRGSTGPP